MAKRKVNYEKPELNVYGNVKKITEGGGPHPFEPHGSS